MAKISKNLPAGAMKGCVGQEVIDRVHELVNERRRRKGMPAIDFTQPSAAVPHKKPKARAAAA